MLYFFSEYLAGNDSRKGLIESYGWIYQIGINPILFDLLLEQLIEVNYLAPFHQLFGILLPPVLNGGKQTDLQVLSLFYWRQRLVYAVVELLERSLSRKNHLRIYLLNLDQSFVQFSVFLFFFLGSWGLEEGKMQLQLDLSSKLGLERLEISLVSWEPAYQVFPLKIILS